MQSITTLAEAEKVLAQYIPLSRKVTGKDITLARMGPLMNLLGNPQHKLTIIHIAGTSGKTSTTYYISALLIASGKKVGTTISPYIDTITERFQINLSPLEESEFALYLSTFLDIIDKAQLKPTYFELLIAFAYWYFVQVGVDYAVIETGLGGLQDSTNIADNPNKICVITDIGYDHMEILGHTIQEIAKQKAGIIHPHNVALMYHQSDAVIGEFQDWCGNVGAELHFHNQEELEERFIAPTVLGGLPLFQRRNFLLAFERCRKGIGYQIFV
jgi:dihydrofolate synthase/folylpolyglutamate synthase